MKTVLIVDDELEMLDMVKLRLESNGYRVLTAPGGKEGIALAEAEQPKLVLLDISMPDMDGFDVLYHLKRNAQTRSIPVIMLTAMGSTDSIIRCQESEAKDYITKPYEAEELLDAIKKQIGPAQH